MLISKYEQKWRIASKFEHRGTSVYKVVFVGLFIILVFLKTKSRIRWYKTKHSFLKEKVTGRFQETKNFVFKVTFKY